MKNKLELIIFFGFVVFSMGIAAVSYFAKAEDLRLVDIRLEQKITGDRVNQLDQRMYLLRAGHRGRPIHTWPQHDQNEYQYLKQEIEKEKKKYDHLLKSKG